KTARTIAWSHASRLSTLGPKARESEIRSMDLFVTDIGREIANPPLLLAGMLELVRIGEQGSVADIIRDLLAGSGEPPPRERMVATYKQKTVVPVPAPLPVASQKRRVVVLGAGQSALTAAFQLTHPKNPRAAEMDVTVYQLGWRLGGKGATGRNPDFGYRIEEHGLHNWFGFYDNCFRQIQDCYAELGRSPDAPLATWQQAFHPANEAIFTEEIDGQHLFWKIQNPPNLETPGTGGLLLPLWEYALMVLEAIGELFQTHAESGAKLDLGDPNEHLPALEQARAHGARTEHGPTPGHDLYGALLELAHRAKDGFEPALRKVVCDIMRAFMRWLWKQIEPVWRTDTPARRFWIMANFGYTNLCGCLEEGVFERGFDVINHYNFRKFLEKYAIDDGGVLLGSPVVRAVYDSSFAYEGGDTTIPPGQTYPPSEAFEAGTALRGMVRSLLTYKGSFGYRFAAGTADTCYAPMYLVMKARGVSFKFFHRVIEVLHDDGDPTKPIVKIRIARQVDITHEQEQKGGYDPLFDVKGLPCWPSWPHWKQIAGGERMRQSGVNLECPPKDFVDAGEIVLERGRDFDDVVLGISIAALPWICGGVIKASTKWQAAVTNVKTVRTQGLQIWLRRTSMQMGFPFPGAPIASWDYDASNALNVWGDLTELLPFEGWPVDPYPLNLGYYTSTLPDDPPPPGGGFLPPCYDCDAQGKKVRDNAIRLLDAGAWIPWPNAVHAVAGRRSFDWDLLVDLRPGSNVGAARIDSQFFKANVALTERYVLSVPNSSRFRLYANDPTEFSNLYLAGDWTWCGLNCGAMESATMSGMLCSLALSGFPARADITGVDFGH
ncbi:MAG: NAD(P)-binding protein, partial [Polyangiaceae bacterium]|nr:NAD(P)-binding protein [Polyangiaceae bacterium]